MKSLKYHSFIVSITCLSLAACSPAEKPQAPADELHSNAHTDGDHDHGGHEHAHSHADEAHDDHVHEEAADHGHDHEHAEAADHAHGSGPHGGTIVDWGGGTYHIELTVDHDQKEVAVYVLGSDAKTDLPVKGSSMLVSLNDPAIQVELTAATDTSASGDGRSAKYVGQHDAFGVVREFSGSVSGVIDEVPYAAEFQE